MKQDLGLFILRLGAGLLFLIAGFGKIMDINAFAPMVWNSLIVAWLVALGEFFGGLALLSGYLMRYATLWLTLIIIGALVLVSIPGFDANNPMTIMNLLFNVNVLTTLVGLAFTGAGRYRIGHDFF